MQIKGVNSMELDKICQLIAASGPAELSTISRQIVRRYGELFENEEIIFLSLPKHDEKLRRQIMEAVIRLEQLKTNEIKTPE